jgi:hypothetical protein
MYNNPNNDQTVAGFPTQQSNYQQPNQFYQNQQSYPNQTYQQQYQPPLPQRSKWYYWFSTNPDAVAYRKTWPKTKAGKVFGCSTLVVAVLLCVLCGTIANANPSSKPETASTQITPTVQVTPTHQIAVLSKPTPSPTAIPTPAPIQQQPTPTPVPAQQSAPTQPPVPTCSGTTINGTCYNTDPNGGTLVYSPPASFCSYFTCVSTFWKDTNGYVAECANAKYTHSGGVSGACSRDGGVIAKVYSR